MVTCPIFTPQRTIDRFVSENRTWLDEKLEEITHQQSALTVSKDTLLFHGKEYQYRLNIGRQKERVELNGSTLLVFAHAEDHQHVRQILEKWYRQQAKEYFTERLPLLADVANQDVRNLTIRSPRTRWGSCTSRSTISLNWRLVMAPDWVSDYVIYHELAHLTHMNHSRNFWQLVETYSSRYKDAETWLKKHHQLLQF